MGGVVIREGALISKNEVEGGAYSGGGAYLKEGAYSNLYGMIHTHTFCVAIGNPSLTCE